MPDDDIIVLIATPEGSEPVWLGYFSGDDREWRTVEGDTIEVTFWQHLPEPPPAAAHKLSRAQKKRIRKREANRAAIFAIDNDTE